MRGYQSAGVWKALHVLEWAAKYSVERELTVTVTVYCKMLESHPTRSKQFQIVSTGRNIIYFD